MIETAIFAQAHGWQPYQVRQLCQDLGIPTRASERTGEDWYRLEVALARGPDWLSDAPAVPANPIKVGDRFLLKSWFEPFDPKNFKPERWEVTQAKNEHRLYLLRSDSGNWASLGEKQINRDSIKE